MAQIFTGWSFDKALDKSIDRKNQVKQFEEVQNQRYVELAERITAREAADAYREKALKEEILHRQKAQGIQPVLYPRNRLSVLGQHLIFSDQHATSDGYFSEIITEDILQRNTPWHDLLLKNNIKFIDPPCWTLVGKDLFIDIDQWEVNDFVEYNPNSRNIIERWAQKWWPEVDIHWVEIGGHNDSCFHTVKPGAIISLDDIMTYTETFPGWEVCYLDDSNIGQLPEFMQAKQKTFFFESSTILYVCF